MGESAFDLLIRLGAPGLCFRTKLDVLNPILELFPGKLYEIDGENGSGKTQICYSFASKYLESLENSPSNGSKIGWISPIPLRTDLLLRHFPPDLRNVSENSIFDRIICRRIEKIAEFRDALINFLGILNLKLIVIENIDAILHDTAYFRETGRSCQLEIIGQLQKLTKLGITVIITNHLTHWRGFPAPALGQFWATHITNRILVERKSEESDIRIVSTMREQLIRIEFRIGDNGLEAVE